LRHRRLLVRPDLPVLLVAIVLFVLSLLVDARGGLLLLLEGTHLVLRVRRLVRYHAGVRMLERGATARASNRIGDAIDTATAPLRLRHIASSARVTLVSHRPLVDVVQILSTLVDVRVHEAA
jgi:hypothetical protein